MPSRSAGVRLLVAMIVASALACPPAPVLAAQDAPAPGQAATTAPVAKPAPPAPAPAGLTDNELQGYACLAGAAVALGLVTAAGPLEVVHVMAGADTFWVPTGGALVVWTAMAASAGALACAGFGAAAPAAIHAWDYLTSVSWLHPGRQ